MDLLGGFVRRSRYVVKDGMLADSSIFVPVHM